ncbi:hypothetical protein IQ254_17580 [Nodosilinea sp. LEGE 07088]|nr:hypothetical protein [Nodosilinea sp. LEGE 07088]
MGQYSMGQYTDIMVGLLVPPLLLGLLVGRALADGLTQAGLASEQIFAGERLPNLNVPQTMSATDDEP